MAKREPQDDDVVLIVAERRLYDKFLAVADALDVDLDLEEEVPTEWGWYSEADWLRAADLTHLTYGIGMSAHSMLCVNPLRVRGKSRDEIRKILTELPVGRVPTGDFSDIEALKFAVRTAVKEAACNIRGYDGKNNESERAACCNRLWAAFWKRAIRYVDCNEILREAEDAFRDQQKEQAGNA